LGIHVLAVTWTPLLLYADGRPELVSKGDIEYEQGNYERAYEYYLNAGVSDPRISFNIASIMSHFRKIGLICEYNAYVDLILEELQYVIEQDSTWLEKILTDTIFSPIHTTVLYNVWKGYNLEDDSSITALLPEVSWYVIVEPVTATDGEIIFQADGSVFVDWGIYYDYDEESDEFLPRSFGKQQGHYRVKERKICIQWDKTYDNFYNEELQGESVFILEQNGVWGILKDASSDQKIFYDIPDECNT
jgi:hypothetical protein